MSVTVKLSLKETMVEELDFLSRTKYADIPRATLVTLLCRRAMDEELDKMDYARCVDGFKTMEEIERDVLIV